MKPMLAVTTNIDVLRVQHKNWAGVNWGFMQACRTKSHIVPVVILISLLGCTSSNATEAIMEIRPNQIIIAADSMITRGNRPSISGCKILRTGKFFFVPIGLTSHIRTDFKIDSFIATAARKEPYSTKKMLDAAGIQLVPALQKEVDDVQRRFHPPPQRPGKPEYIVKIFAARETGAGLEGFEKSFPVEAGRVSADPARTCRDEEEGLCRLYTSEALRYFAISRPDLWNTASMDALMKIAMDANRDSSGPPVSILVIAPNATHWVRQNDCADIAREAPKRKNPK